MPKFSILGDEEEIDNDDHQLCFRNPKKRRTLNPPQSFSSVSSPTAPFISLQQQHTDNNDDDLLVGPTSASSKSGGPISVVLSDPDVLDCSICFNPLTIPVFQCDNGHIACSSCCNNLGNKCPSCCGKIGNNRCRAIEKVIESAQVSCCYFKYGCQETVSYCKKHEHEKNCTYAPCLCPFPNCHFRGSTKRLSSHVRKEHTDLVVNFRYNSVFSVSPRMGSNFLVLREERDGILFVVSHGNTIDIRCVDPSLSNAMFAYDLVLRRGSTSLKFESFTHCTTWRLNETRSDDYLLVPAYFYSSSGMLKLEICIRNKDATSSPNIP